MSIRLMTCLVVVVEGLVLFAPLARAGPRSHPGFDVLRHADQLTVALDVSPVITTERIDLMLEGIRFRLEYDLTLSRPRRLWGSSKVRSVSGWLIIGHNLVTDAFSITRESTESGPEELWFESLAGLHRFLKDSILVNIIPVDSLETNKGYSVGVSMALISLTLINLATSEGDADGSALKYLFRKFLEVTGYGREEYSASSDPFFVSELRRLE